MHISRKTTGSWFLFALLLFHLFTTDAHSAPAPFLESWTKASLNNAKSVAFGNAVYVAVGDQSNIDFTALIYLSTNGADWTTVKTGREFSLYSVCYGHGKFVAAGFSGSATSETGSSWTFQSQTQSLIKVIPIDSGFASVTAGGHVGFSEDGSKWDFHNTATNLFLEAIAFANGRFVIGGNARLSVSTNKTEWQDTPFPNYNFYDVAFGKGLFVAVGAEGSWWTDGRETLTTNQIWISTDGTNWKKVHHEFDDVIQTVAYCNGVFIAAADWGHSLHSTDGINWSKSSLPFTTFKISSANNRFFSAGYPFVWSSSEIMSLEARPTQLQIFGPIGKIVTIHSTDSIGGPLTSTTVSLTSMPTIINNPNAFVFGSIN